MALVSTLMAMMAAFTVSMTAWITGAVSLLEAFGLYIAVGLSVMVASFALFFVISLLRTRPRNVSAPMPALAPIPVRSSSS